MQQIVCASYLYSVQMVYFSFGILYTKIMKSDDLRMLGLGLKENGNIELDASVLKGLKKMPVDIFDNVYLGEMKPEALILCIDIRNFSNFLCQHGEQTVFDMLTSFTSNFLSCVNQLGTNCSYYKLLGDGALVIWDTADKVAVEEALMVFNSYLSFVKEEFFTTYPDLGLGGALVQEVIYKYEISAEMSSLKYRDYFGYGINLACRLQGIANGDQLIVNKALAEKKHFDTVVSMDAKLLEELRRLKGLKEDDREAAIFYTQQ